MRKAEAQGASAVEMTASVMLGGVLALGVELMILFFGAIGVSKGIWKADAAPQLTAAACVTGCLAGGLLTCSRWSARRVLAGLATGGVCWLLVLGVGLLLSGSFELGSQALIELAGCLCGGAIAGIFSGRGKKKKRTASRKK